MSVGNPWCSGIITSILFFQIGSSIPVEFHTLEVKGGYNNNVDSFSVKYSSDGMNWTSYNSEQVFQRTEVLSRFNFVPFIARTIRLYMNNPVSNTCGKFEVLVKPLTYNNVLTPTSIISALSSGFKLRVSTIYSNSYHYKNATSNLSQEVENGVVKYLIKTNG